MCNACGFPKLNSLSLDTYYKIRHKNSTCIKHMKNELLNYIRKNVAVHIQSSHNYCLWVTFPTYYNVLTKENMLKKINKSKWRRKVVLATHIVARRMKKMFWVHIVCYRQCTRMTQKRKKNVNSNQEKASK